MAANLSVKSHLFIGIHKICPHETEIVCLGNSRIGRDNKVHQSRRKTQSLAEITHEVHYVSESFAASISNIMSPSQEVAMMVWFGAASAIQRPSHSKALMYGDDIYYLMTYTDVLGKGHGKQCDLHRTREKRFVNFLQIITNPDHKQIITERVIEAWGAAWNVQKNESE